MCESLRSKFIHIIFGGTNEKMLRKEQPKEISQTSVRARTITYAIYFIHTHTHLHTTQTYRPTNTGINTTENRTQIE